MNIATKYNVGDKFWIIKDNHVVDIIVETIQIEVSGYPSDNYGLRSEASIWYNGRYKSDSRMETIHVEESKFYPTKEALLASL